MATMQLLLEHIQNAGAQSAGAVEYTYCISISAERWLLPTSVLYMMQNNLMGGSSIVALGNVEYTFLAIAPRFTLARGLVAPDRVLSMSQTELLEIKTVCKQMTLAELTC